MTAEQLIARVNDSIARALRGESVLDQQVLDIKGFSTGVQRRLVSNLAHGLRYLEVGVHVGSSFCAAINNNPEGLCIGIENWSQGFGVDAKAEFKKNMESIGARVGRANHPKFAACEVMEKDCFEVDLIPSIRFEMFYFDGEHSEASHRRALPHFLQCLDKQFIFLVDDWNWEDVSGGTRAGFEELKDRITIENEWLFLCEGSDHPVWHNGVAIWVISQK